MIYHVTDWDDAYANGAHIPQAEGFVPRWQSAAAAFRETHPPKSLGRGHLFHPGGTPNGLMIFIHGGYWMRFDPGIWSHLAAGALARGWAVAMPAYTLAPQARIRQMVAVIGDSANEASIRLHKAFGFQPIGTLRSVGRKHGRWLDTVLMQLALGDGDETAPEVE